MFRSLRGKKSPKPSRKELKQLQKKVPKLIWEAENNPSKIGNFASCGLEELSGAIVSACKRKTTLLLYDNSLEVLNGIISRLPQLVVLDLHKNLLHTLPKEIGCLKQLKILNLEHNCLDRLPVELGQLQLLDTLNIQDNGLVVLPECVLQLKSLRTLNLRNNALAQLPSTIAQLVLLETLELEGNPLDNIPADTLAQGTAAVMKLCCERAGTPYHPPSHYAGDVLNITSASSADALLHYRQEEEARVARMMESTADRERLRLEAQSAAMAAVKEQEARQQQLLQQQREQRATLAQQLQEQESSQAAHRMHLNDQAAQERLAILAHLRAEADDEDRKAREAVENWEQARRNPAMMAALMAEEDRLQSQFLAAAIAREASQQAAVDAQRRSEDQAVMLAQGAVHAKQELRQQALAQLAHHQACVDQALSGYLDKMSEQRDHLSDSRVAQDRQALALAAGATAEQHERQLERQREIRELEEAMANLAASAESHRAVKDASKQAAMTQERLAMEQKLEALQQEQARQLALREQALVSLNEAEERNSRAYWEAKVQASMAQLQALGAPVPTCDAVTQAVLEGCECGDLVPLFATHRIDAVVLRILTDEDLIKMGVASLGQRKRVLLAIQHLFGLDRST
eukprot:m.146006 g.146006  ORF g.146006 m.146006 type:complete len:633 (-) comp16227_c0_seq10:2228-4126(-)